ncbi:MAG: type II and III secretion system protein family protein [Geminicoccaceae bacterium]
MLVFPGLTRSTGPARIGLFLILSTAPSLHVAAQTTQPTDDEAALAAAVSPDASASPGAASAAASPAATAPGRATPRAATGVAGTGRLAITLNVGAGRVVTLTRPAASLFAADPKVAEVRPASPTSLFVFGIAPGRTTIAAVGEDGAPVAQIDLTVHPSSFGSGEVAGMVRSRLRFPGVDIKATPGGYTVTGHAETAADAERVLSAVRPYLAPGQTIDNRLAVETPLTVNLRVRVVEVQRTVTRQLGINWAAAVVSGGFVTALSVVNRVTELTNPPDRFAIGYNGANGGVNAIIDALAQDQLAVILAEPNLTTQSGETASFLAGGEYPIPIAQQNNTITVEYKQYGVSLAFVPTVLSADRISLRVRPEVSELTTQGAVAISNGNLTLNIPALTVRRADTTVELGSGQSFAIAGLLSDNSTQNARGLPSLGELPVLGPLFRSTAFQRGQTELVIIVTPYLVRAVSNPTTLVTPTRDMVLSNDLDRIVYNRQLARGVAPLMMTHIPLDTGFIAP